MSGSEKDYREEEDRDSVSAKLPALGKQERSQSRGREAFSTGRGGIGNIRQTSESRPRPDTKSDDLSGTRGREPTATSAKIYSTGRGGAGNIRSPSRDVNAQTRGATEEEIIRNHIVASQDTPHSSGRGGLGNINTSRSRSRGPPHPVHSTGRGGAGNILTGDAPLAETVGEEEKKKYASAGGPPPYHPTGRGGIANLTSAPQPAPEPIVHTVGEYGSTGRGGAGNQVHNG